MRQYIYRCDGCDWERTTGTDKLPDHWAEVEIVMSQFTNWRSGEGERYGVYPLLCPQCQIKLRDNATPAKWPRAAKETA